MSRPPPAASRDRRLRGLAAAALAAAAGLLLAGCARQRASETGSTNPRSERGSVGRVPADPACEQLTPAAAGGPMPRAPLLALRWLGTSNYELAYDRTVVLLDAHYDRGPRSRPIGVTADAITRADLIVVGHPHFDHISDAATVARRTGATVVGAPLAVEFLRAAGVPAAQTRAVTGTGGEVLEFPGFTVEPILARHGELSRSAMAKFGEAIAEVLGPPSPEEAAAERVVAARGTFDPRVPTEGTLAYLFTFEGGFRLVFLDSAGPITDFERALMRRIGRTDVAIVAYQGQYLARAQIASTLPLIKLFRPGLYLPSHHDEIVGFFPDLGIEPLLMAIRDELPGTRTLAPLYRDPICLNSERRIP